METYYLRLEAVNLGNFIFDTNDLSTLRGGGLLLLRAVDNVQSRFRELTPISTGASSGLFEFDADENTAESVKQKVSDFLSNDWRFRHATFVVDVLPASNDFRADREKLLARNRWQQLQAPTVIFPETASTAGVCKIDLVRPAVYRKNLKGETDVWISPSVHQRRRYGVRMKHHFYQEELRQLPDNQLDLQTFSNFSRDFTELAEDKTQGNLNGKLAIIYLDGNSFGKIQQDCKTAKELREFDHYIKTCRRLFLRDLLTAMQSDEAWYFLDNGTPRYRLETLLWGGDELMLAVPAWKGLETLQRFFQSSKDWKIAGEKLTHAAGVVFCHSNAPIHRITHLAKHLAEECKAKSRKENLVAYEVLESFDHAGLELGDFRKERRPLGLSPEELLWHGENTGDIQAHLYALKEALPKGRVHGWVRKWLSGEKTGKFVRDELQKAIRALPAARQSVEQALAQKLHPLETAVLHLLALWDYLVPQTTTPAVEEK
jgi:hypothetical protein